MNASANPSTTHSKAEGIPPRARILAAAGELFYRHGIRAVGVESIAEAAGTNKMTLYRHFASKDELVAEYLRQEAGKADASWCALESQHPGEPLAQIRAWMAAMAAHAAECNERGCALANAAVELPEKEHPARAVIEECKRRQRAELIRLCGRAGLAEPEMLADEFLLLIEGARVTAQSMGADGLGPRLVRMSEALIAAHTPSPQL
jgi:AcrR family transcriptional regulator